MVRVVDVAGWRHCLHEVREPGRLPGQEPEADALQVSGLPPVLLAQDMHGDGGLEAPPPALGLGNLPRNDEPEGSLQHEALP